MPKHSLGMDVLTAAKDRISFVFDKFDRIYVSFSAGKDSAVMLHLVIDEARKRGRKVGVLFIDWECQIGLTIDFAKATFEQYADDIDLYWVALPMRTWNACSQIEPEWTAWDESKKDLWVRQPDTSSITDCGFFPFYTEEMSFEDFVPAFAQWYGNGQPCACFVGIRADESLNRFRTVARSDKPTFEGKMWTTKVDGDAWNAYPIYDWQTADIWRYLGKFDKPYNKLYDRMHQAGIKISQMRICEPSQTGSRSDGAVIADPVRRGLSKR